MELEKNTLPVKFGDGRRLSFAMSPLGAHPVYTSCPHVTVSVKADNNCMRNANLVSLCAILTLWLKSNISPSALKRHLIHQGCVTQISAFCCYDPLAACGIDGTFKDYGVVLEMKCIHSRKVLALSSMQMRSDIIDLTPSHHAQDKGFPFFDNEVMILGSSAVLHPRPLFLAQADDANGCYNHFEPPQGDSSRVPMGVSGGVPSGETKGVEELSPEHPAISGLEALLSDTPEAISPEDESLLQSMEDFETIYKELSSVNDFFSQ